VGRDGSLVNIHHSKHVLSGLAPPFPGALTRPVQRMRSSHLALLSLRPHYTDVETGLAPMFKNKTKQQNKTNKKQKQQQQQQKSA
jgi:hypothetical protein